jgi:hypothetical protein
MKSDKADLYIDISDGVFVFTSLISLLFAFVFGSIYDKLLTDQVEWVQYSLIKLLFDKLPTLVVLGFMSLRCSVLLQWRHLSARNYELTFSREGWFIFIFVWTSLLGWFLFNLTTLIGFWLGLEFSDQGSAAEYIGGLLREFNWNTSLHSFLRLIAESFLLALLILVENNSNFLRFNDAAKGLTRSYLFLITVLISLEFLDVYLFF